MRSSCWIAQAACLLAICERRVGTKVRSTYGILNKRQESRLPAGAQRPSLPRQRELIARKASRVCRS
jgi:hypothetical protein